MNGKEHEKTIVIGIKIFFGTYLYVERYIKQMVRQRKKFAPMIFKPSVQAEPRARMTKKWIKKKSLIKSSRALFEDW